MTAGGRNGRTAAATGGVTESFPFPSSPPGVSAAAGATRPLAIYARVSTEDQADRETIKTQVEFLGRLAEARAAAGIGGPVAGAYLDDGVSGKVPLGERPEGRRLLDDAAAGRFGEVWFYKVSRLGRSLPVLLDAHAQLERLGVAIKSGTEPLDTAGPIGTFVFQLLGSLAELDHATIAENTSRGRRRRAEAGGYTGGPIAFGLDLTDDGVYVPSQVAVPELGCTEGDLVRGMLERLDAGTTTVSAEWTRLRAHGVARRQRFARSAERAKRGEPAATIENPHGWGYSSLLNALKNPILMGEGRYRSAYGEVVRRVVPLVSREVWEGAQRTIAGNRAASPKNATRTYGLRGLVVCGNCGANYTGATIRRGTHAVYRCNGNNRRQAKRAAGCERCFGKQLAAEWLEATVWAYCERFVRDPDATIEDARRRLRARLADSTGLDERRRAVQAELAGKDGERQRMHERYRKGRLTEAEYDGQLEAIAAEAGALRAELERVRARAEAVEAHEAFLAETTAFLARLRAEVDAIVAGDDRGRKAAVMAKLVRSVVVTSRRGEGRTVAADVEIGLKLEAATNHVDIGTSGRPDIYLSHPLLALVVPVPATPLRSPP